MVFLKKVLPYDNSCEAAPAIYRIELFLNDVKKRMVVIQPVILHERTDSV